MKHIEDPCLPNTPQNERSFFMACYAASLIAGENLVCKAIKKDTINRYLKAAALLCVPRKLLDPRHDEQGRMGFYLSKVLREHERWEKMPNRREPVTHDMIEHIIRQARHIDKDSLLSALSDWCVLGEYTGARLGEWAQDHKDTKRGKIGRNHVDNSARAFIFVDFQFEGARSRRLKNAENK